MRIAFMGSPEFAVPALRALHDAGHDIAAVYCQPARPAGRGQAMRRSPVQVEADRLGLPLRTPARLRTDPDAAEAFRRLHLDAAVVAAYGLILPPPMLEAPHRGCLNIHASLLPRWRGAAPIQAAVLAGDAETGVTIMQMEAGLDSGPMLLRQSVPISSQTTTAMLHDALAAIGAKLILDALATSPTPMPQHAPDVTYAAKLSRQDGRIDWHESAAIIDRRIRAFDPWPGTFTSLAGSALKILAAHPANGSGIAGTVLDGALTVACGNAAVRLTRVQLPGRAPLDADAFLRGHPVPSGTVLGQ
ncbi:methionyl-tRNA formyltransferase [Rhodopila sp.]|uniref:methionyl-tRNA formyltransferase n=1 Tax=Rhodopila sp. TaxID=2480087 RepID=UPI003D0BDFAF